MITEQFLKAPVRPRRALPFAESLAIRVATAPGLVRPGVGSWNGARLPIHALSIENAYGDPELLGDLAARGAEFARRLDVDVVVGAETAGVPLGTAVSMVGTIPFAFVRKPGYRGHEIGEPQVRGADVAGRRVLLVDDAVWSGAAIEGFVGQLARSAAEVVGVFCLVDMRDIATTISPAAEALPIESVISYLDVLAIATDAGVISAGVHDLVVDALVNPWSETDARWQLIGGK